MKTKECMSCNWTMRAEFERYHVQSDKEFKKKVDRATELWKCTKCGVVGIGAENTDWYSPRPDLKPDPINSFFENFDDEESDEDLL